MLSTATPWEPEIPLPHDPAIAGPPTTPESPDRTFAALRSLVWLSLYVAIMRLLGYRIARDPRRRPQTPSPAQPPAPIPPHATQARPRQKHRYLDRALCLNMLSGISQAFAPAPQVPAPPVTALEAPAPTALAPTAPAPHPNPAPSMPRAILIPASRPVRAPHRPPRVQKPRFALTPTHAHFVAISKRTTISATPQPG